MSLRVSESLKALPSRAGLPTKMPARENLSAVVVGKNTDLGAAEGLVGGGVGGRRSGEFRWWSGTVGIGEGGEEALGDAEISVLDGGGEG